MAFSTYTITNSKTHSRTEISEVMMVDILNTIKNRKPELFRALLKKFEELENRTITEKDLIY